MVIRIENIKVTFRRRDWSLVTDDCVATLHKSDHKTYGNGTSVVIDFGRGEPYQYDTRYEVELNDPDNFGRWVRNFIACNMFTNVVSVE